jgi:hypothetical protein
VPSAQIALFWVPFDEGGRGRDARGIGWTVLLSSGWLLPHQPGLAACPQHTGYYQVSARMPARGLPRRILAPRYGC